jgi:gliding motility-associated-like protein
MCYRSGHLAFIISITLKKCKKNTLRLKRLIGIFLLLGIPNLLFSQGYNFVGDAFQATPECYVVTAAAEWQNGAIWYNEPIEIDQPFDLQFLVNFGGNDAGADGVVFVMQQVGNDVIGVAGGGIGFQGFSPSLGVEFDTWSNFETADPVFDHLSILRNGDSNHNSPNNLAGPIPISPTSDNVEDNQQYIVDISWEPSINQFTVSVNCEQRLQISINLQQTVFPGSADIFWGFTGATGGEFNEQVVCLSPYILGLPEEFQSCAGEPVQLTSPDAIFGSVSWEPAEFLDDPNSSTPIATVDETTTFTLTFEDLCGAQEIQTTTVVVNDPSLDLGPDFSVCEGEEFTLQVSSEYEDVVWSTGVEGLATTQSEAGVYWVDAVQDGCAVSDTVVVGQNPSPDYDGETDVTLCEGEEFTLDLNPDVTSVEWFDGNTDPDRVLTETGTYSFTLSNDFCTSESVIDLNFVDLSGFDLGSDISGCDGEVFTLLAAGDFEEVAWSNGSFATEITVEESGVYFADVSIGSCSASDTVVVDLAPLPTFDQPTVDTICQGDDFLFMLNEPSYSIEWFDGSTESIRLFDQTGSYSFQLTEAGCSNAFDFQLEVTPIPTFDLGPEQEICSGETILLFANAAEANLLWNTGATSSSIQVSTPGTFWARASVSDCTFSDTTAVDVNPVPTLSLQGDSTVCPDTSVVLFANSNAPVIWSTGEEADQIQVSQSGLYSAEATNQFGCSAQASFRVEGLEVPEIGFIGSVVKCQEEAFVLVDANSNDNERLVWSNGVVGPSARLSSIGEYFVRLTNECGADTVNFTVVEEECLRNFFLPNAFTPDGDGLNDLLKGVIGPHEKFEMRIYDRNGQLVFETKDPNQGWNGSNQNGDFFCQAGVYTIWYKIEWDEFNVQENFGFVTLIR